jgi:hypothetical protein
LGLGSLILNFRFVLTCPSLIGGDLLSEQSKSSFYLDIKVTDETNTKDEKADYIREVFEGFKGILGDLHDEIPAILT